MSNITTADLENEMALIDMAYKMAQIDIINAIRKLPTHEYREYDGHDEIIIRECVYVSDIMDMLNKQINI